ncbi:pentatricopeptide repeat-containing protein At3g42630 isoform X2 [Herrania umbratica]|uniref:Pentatricopeptide repeat-containing protein At3g42630 isoform X2 n=1 Tax=Herrania umbratica TaxID=108875 RepID=A0A6J0ZKW6_9ROSI|nr:pentatricopeptide repeat-containing protein At3g42630 isoform X2 [Herrania umbratica]
METQWLVMTTPPLPLFRRTSAKSGLSSSSSPNSNNNLPLARRIIRQWKRDGSILGVGRNNFVDFDSLLQTLASKTMPQPHVVHHLLLQGLIPNNSTLSEIMLWYADNGLFPQAQVIWEEMLNTTSFTPAIQVVSRFMDAYGKMGHFHKVHEILDQVTLHRVNLSPEVYPVAISCFGKHGRLYLMENTLKEMVSRGLPVDSATGNAFLRYYSIFGSLSEMEIAYARLKRSRHLIEEEGIRAMSSAYIKEGKFYRLGEFLNDLGLGRRNLGNLLWNLLLLSYAANFKMKTMQRLFLKMMDSGFRPDLTTFNIRALAFSRMSMFWDLHLSLEHMKHESVVPDLVTYGCVVDAYLDRRLARNLDFALNHMNADDSPLVLTDPLVFEALGKGDFHSSSEAFLQFKRQKKKWTYRQLIAVYLKKQFRRNQIFWNY